MKCESIIKGKSYYCPSESDEVIPWSGMTKEQKETAYDKQSKRGSVSMSAYYKQNIKEYQTVFIR